MSSTKKPKPKRIYLDVCTLCRPLDDQQQIRIRLETSAVELIIDHIRKKQIELIVSTVHDTEIGAITNLEERGQLTLLLEQLGTRIRFDLTAVRQRAEQLVAQGIGAADAAHLAFAEQAQAEFVTVDDRLFKKCRRIKSSVWSGSPLTYCDKENLK